MKKVNICIAGGGSTYTPGILIGLIKKKESFPVKRIILYDNNERRLERMGQYSQILLKDYYPEAELIYTTDITKAFKNIDFVFCQIRTGGFKMRELDEKIPLRNNVIGQETCGPGGFAYGLRSIRDMIDLVKAIRKDSPAAWILNYTNPAAIVALALDQAFPDDKRILNICDQPISLLMAYARLLGDIDYKDMIPYYFGLNHFGWFTKIIDKRNGEDITPKIKQLIFKNGFAPADKEQRDPSWLVTYGAVKQMLKLDPTYLPNTYLQYYLLPKETIEHLDPSYTRANEVMDGRDKRVYEQCERVIQHQTTKIDDFVTKELTKKDAHGEMIVEIAEAIFHDQERYYVVMVKNKGIIPNLPEEAIIEVLCTLGANGATPLDVGPVSTYYKGLIEQQYAYERLTCEAYFEGSYLKALQALTLNRTVVDMALAKKILDELIVANRDYWPEMK
ncbi:MAG: 6-phospho-alpha-glucosidase [Bacilli bacterium]|mgnify:FL=1|nr:6-phospho-alpha-glucosidase [Bacilli bacterium]HHU24997.1 6-phospho-alpha-glucosidase [Acholeplasmataceae bacterium]